MLFKTEEELKRVFIFVDDDTLTKVEQVMESEGWTKSGIVEEAVKKCLKMLKEGG